MEYSEAEQRQIIFCLHKAEEKFGGRPAKNWSNQDMARLTKEVHTASGVRLSLRSLHKAWNKAIAPTPHNPKILNALSVYVGYQSWADFKANNPPESLPDADGNSARIANPDPIGVPNTKPVPPNTLNRLADLSSKPAFFIIVACIIVVASVVYLYNNGNLRQLKFHKPDENISISLEENTNAKAPHTVVLNYDLPKDADKQYFVDFGDVYFDQHNSLNLQASKQKITHNYILPYYYKITITTPTDTIKKYDLLVASDGWFSDITYRHNLEKTYKFMPVGNFTDTATGHLHVKPEQINRKGIYNSNYVWVEFRNFKEFDAHWHNFTWKSKVRNSEEKGGAHCYDIIFIGVFQNGLIQFNLLSPGCTRWARIKVGSIEHNGIDTNLSQLGLDFQKWQEVTIAHKNNKLSVSTADKELYAMPTNNVKKLGQLKGLIYVMKGCGEIASVSLINENGQEQMQPIGQRQ